MKYNFIKHVGIKNPVGKVKYVAYKTINANGDPRTISHVHMPIQAKFLDWGSSPTFRIYEYAVVAKPKKIKPPIALDRSEVTK